MMNGHHWKGKKRLPHAARRLAQWACCTLLVLLHTSTALSQAPPFEWVRQAGGASSDQAKSIAIDTTGNIYVTGSYQGAATFGGINLANPGTGLAMFLAKYDLAGNLLWAKSAGSSLGDCLGSSVACDGTGNCYLAGSCRGTVNFGNTNLAANGTLQFNDAGASTQGWRVYRARIAP